MSQHRIYLGRPHPGADLFGAMAYWHHGHSRTVRDMPLLRGYVQNRPMPSWWTATPYLTCAETWFDSRDDEQASYASDYYLNVIVPDEAKVISPVDAWNAAVASDEVLSGGERSGMRLLAFGVDTVPDGLDVGRVELLHLRREGPDGSPPVVLSAWSTELGMLDAAAHRLGGTTFVCTPAAVLVPAGEGWESCAVVDGTDADPLSPVS